MNRLVVILAAIALLSVSFAYAEGTFTAKPGKRDRVNDSVMMTDFKADFNNQILMADTAIRHRDGSIDLSGHVRLEPKR